MTDWTPAELNPTFWVDFSDNATLTLAGSTITAVANKGSQVLAITNTGSPQLITAAQNGLDVAQLQTGNALQLSASATPAGDRTVAVVWNRSGGSITNILGAPPNNSLFSVNGDRWFVAGTTTHGISYYNDPAQYYTQIHTTDRVTADRYADGRVHSRNQPVTTADTFTKIAETDSALFLLAEVVIWDSILTAENLLTLEGYFAAKWGLQGKLPGFHPYKTVTPQVDDVLSVAQVAWTPDRQGSSLWLDASDASTIILSGLDVVEIRDKTGHGNKAQASSIPDRPSILSAYQNGLDVMEFTSTDLLGLVNGVGATWEATPPGPRMTFVVGQPASNTRLFMLGNLSAGFQTVYITGVWFVGTISQSVPIPTGQVSLVGHVSDRSTATRYLDGVGQGATATNTTDSATLIGQSGENYGSTPNGMKIGEVLILAIDSTDDAVRQKAEGYLAQKWGLTLDPGHPYASATPTIDVYSVAVDGEIPDYEIELCTSALADYLPNDRTFEAKGIAGSNLRDLLQGLAHEFCRGQAYIDQYSDDYHPATTQTYLDEWERAVGIPDDCFLGTGSTAERQRDIVIKLAAMNIQTAQDIIDLAALLGLTVSVAYGTTATPPLDVPFTPQSETGAYTIIIEGVGIFGGLPPFDVPFVPGSTVNVLECLLAKQIQADCEILFREA